MPDGFRLPPPSFSPAQTRGPSRSLTVDISSRFGRRIRELRLAHGLTQAAMARTFGIDRTFISDLERGKKATTLEFVELLALGFGITMSALMDKI